MRLSYILLFIAATLLASVNASSSDATEPVKKKAFTLTSGDSNSELEGMYIRKGNKKFLILLYDDGSEDASDESASDEDASVDDGSPSEENSGSDASTGQEERAGFGEVVKKLKSSSIDSKVNKVLSAVFKKLTPEELRLPAARTTNNGRFHPFRND